MASVPPPALVTNYNLTLDESFDEHAVSLLDISLIAVVVASSLRFIFTTPLYLMKLVTQDVFK